MPKAGKKNHILGDFFSEGTKKKRENGEGIRYRRKENVFFKVLRKGETNTGFGATVQQQPQATQPLVVVLLPNIKLS